MKSKPRQCQPEKNSVWALFHGRSWRVHFWVNKIQNPRKQMRSGRKITPPQPRTRPSSPSVAMVLSLQTKIGRQQRRNRNWVVIEKVVETLGCEFRSALHPRPIHQRMKASLGFLVAGTSQTIKEFCKTSRTWIHQESCGQDGAVGSRAIENLKITKSYQLCMGSNHWILTC
jgi:hypothetical protein